VLAHRVEGLLESRAALGVDLLNQLLELRFGAGQIANLGLQELQSLLQFIVFADRFHVHIPKPLNLFAQFP